MSKYYATRIVMAGAFVSLGCAAHAQTAPAAPAPAAPAPPAAPAAPASVSLPAPGMAGPLAFQSVPWSVDTGPLGKWYVDGVLSGLALGQSNQVPGDKNATIDLSNGTVILQKIDGLVQFYAQLGAYSIPALGTQYSKLLDSEHAEGNLYSAVPQAFLKLQPTDTFSIQAGKLPTLIGAESTFTFEDMNIERGLLWNQEPAVSRGVQANYTIGPVTVNLSLNDGYYSDKFNWISGLVTWTINPTNTLAFDGGGNVSKTELSTVATPLAQNNSSIFNIIYTYNNAPWVITPYVQYSHVASNATIGLPTSVNTYGGAVLATYTIDDHWSLGGRGEFLVSDGARSNPLAVNTLYGPGSKAFSLTITPTYKINQFFVRGDLSYVDVFNLVNGYGFGSNFNNGNQFRGVLEAGVVF